MSAKVFQFISTLFAAKIGRKTCIYCCFCSCLSINKKMCNFQILGHRIMENRFRNNPIPQLLNKKQREPEYLVTLKALSGQPLQDNHFHPK